MRLWCQQDIPTELRKIYEPKLRSYSGGRSQIHRANDTSILRDNGAGSAPGGVATSGCHQMTPNNNPYSLLCSQLNAGKVTAHHRVDTVRAKLSHVRWCRQLHAGYRPALPPQHELVLQNMRRLSSPPSPARCSFHRDAPPDHHSIRHVHRPHRVLCGAAVLGFFFCLRGAEYLCSRGKRHVYSLQVGDVI